MRLGRRERQAAGELGEDGCRQQHDEAGKQERNRSTVDQIEVYLRADPNLDEHAAETIANVVKQVYDGFKAKKKIRKG